MRGLTPLLLVVGCFGDAVPEAAPPDERVVTDPNRYPALDRRPVNLADGLHAVVKLVAEHTLSEGDTTASFVAQGAGSLVVTGDRWRIVTARHLVVPDPGLEEITHPLSGSTTYFDKIDHTAVRVAIGSLGLPIEAVVIGDQDVAFLDVAPEHREAMLGSAFLDAARPIPLGGEVASGRTIEAWGFPAKHLPQVAKPSIVAVQPGWFAVNEALPRGYSGGPVLTISGDGKRVVGVVTRSDDEAGQSRVVAWSAVASLLAGGGTRIEAGAEGVVGGVTLEVRR